MQSLLSAIRQAASPALWSQGVQLVRSDAVFLAAGASKDAEEVELQVKPTQGNVLAHVTLWPGEDEWSCQCDAPEDPCIHAVAAAIALGQARQGRMALGARQATCHVAYRFFRTPGGLTLERWVLGGGQDQLLAVPLAVRLRAAGPLVATLTHDSVIDSLVADRPQLGQIPLGPALIGRVLAGLEGARHVELDHQPVAIGESIAPWTLHISRRSHGALLVQIKKTAGIKEIFANGVARTEAGLSPLLEEGMGRYERAKWQTPQVVAADEVPRFLGSVLPELTRRLPIVWHDVQAPELDPNLNANIAVTLSQNSADALVVVASLTYGDPEAARVVRGELRVLGQKMPRRDLRREAELEGLVAERLGLKLNEGKALRGPEAAAFRMAVMRQARQLGWRLSEHHDIAERYAIHQELSARLEAAGDDVEVVFGIPQQSHAASPGAVLQAFLREEPLVALDGGGFAPLPQAWLAQHAEAVQMLLEGRQAAAAERGGPPPPSMRAAMAQLLDAAAVPIAGTLPGWASQTLRVEKQDLAQPESLLAPDVQLRHYQRDGVGWLRSRRRLGLGALLADDMGLGKTLQTLAVLTGRSLVVAPSSVLFNWKQEITRFRPALSICDYFGPRRQLDADAAITLTSFDILRLDAAELTQISWDTVVVDEAQRLKNADSQSARAARQLKAGWRLLLTGTPVENRLDELWSLMAFLNPGLLGERAAFARSIVDKIAAGDPQAGVRLRARVGPCLLRRTKKQVLPSLPPRTDLLSFCELDAEERAAYDAVRAATRREVVAKFGAGGSMVRALEALLRLRQASCHRGLLPGMSAPSSSKLRLLMGHLSEVLAAGHKALVFSQWTQLLDRVEPLLRTEGHTFARLDGHTASRQAVVEQFMAEDGPPVLLASLKAGGVGLNLTAADHVFLLDPWWNPAAEDQAADRAHRIGQQRPVFVHRLVAAQTVEEKIMALQAKKRAIADALLDGATSDVELDREELLELLAG